MLFSRFSSSRKVAIILHEKKKNFLSGNETEQASKRRRMKESTFKRQTHSIERIKKGKKKERRKKEREKKEREREKRKRERKERERKKERGHTQRRRKRKGLLFLVPCVVEECAKNRP